MNRFRSRRVRRHLARAWDAFAADPYARVAEDHERAAARSGSRAARVEARPEPFPGEVAEFTVRSR